MCLYACVHAKLLQSCLTLVTLWTVACQAPLSLGFSRQEYWSGLPCPPAGDLPDPGIKPASPMSPAVAGSFFTTSSTSRQRLLSRSQGQRSGISFVVIQSFSWVRLLATPWTGASQAPLSTGFSRQEYCSGLPFPPPGHLPDPEIETMSTRVSCIAGGFFTSEPLRKSILSGKHINNLV